MSLRLIASARPRVHHDALDWARRVAANGGSVSQSTLRSVSAFCDAIDRAAIRDRFYRLNLFCGTGLPACLVPLYRGPSLGGTQYGGATDANFNFVGTDYSETGSTGGLDGDLFSKYLNTGLTYDAMGVPSTNHIGVFKGAGTWTSNQEIIGARDTEDFYYIQGRTNVGSDYKVHAFSGQTNFVNNATVSVNTSFLLVSRTSATSLVLYENDVSVGTNTTSTTPGGCNRSFLVFARDAGTGPADPRWPYRLLGYSFGIGLSSTQVAAYNSAMQAFQTALGRNV